MIESVFIFQLVQHLGNCYPFISFYLKLEKSILESPRLKWRKQTTSNVFFLINTLLELENNKLHRRKAIVSSVTSFKFLNFNSDLNQ